MTLEQLARILERDAVIKAIDGFADGGDFRISPEEIMIDRVTEASARLGHAIGKGLGLKRGTSQAFDIDGGLAAVWVAVIMALTKQEIMVEAVAEDGAEIGLVGGIPGNWAVHEGLLDLSIRPNGARCAIAMTVIYEGQFFTWGEGPRRLRKLEADIRNALASSWMAELALD